MNTHSVIAETLKIVPVMKSPDGVSTHADFRGSIKGIVFKVFLLFPAALKTPPIFCWRNPDQLAEYSGIIIGIIKADVSRNFAHRAVAFG